MAQRENDPPNPCTPQLSKDPCCEGLAPYRRKRLLAVSNDATQPRTETTGKDNRIDP